MDDQLVVPLEREESRGSNLRIWRDWARVWEMQEDEAEGDERERDDMDRGACEE